MQNCEVVLKGVSTDLNFYLTAYVVPVICAPLQNHATKVAHQYYPHLRGLKLADDPAENPALEMDILVGSDSYCYLVTGKVKRGRSDPVALNTKLGWVLSGPVYQQGAASSLTVNYVSAHTLRTDIQHVNLDDQLSKFLGLKFIGIK